MLTAEKRRQFLRAALIDGAILVLVVTAYFLAPSDGGSATSITVRLIAALAILAVVAIVGIRTVASSDQPAQRALEALVALVVLAILLFAGTYVLMSNANEAAFSEPLNHTRALYFSVTTATTVGYGDITARTDPARIAVMIQMVVDFALIGTAIRVLAHTAQRRINSR